MILCAVGHFVNPSDWSNKPDAEHMMEDANVMQILKYLPFNFAPDMLDLIKADSRLYEEVTEENIDQWEEDYGGEK